MRYRAHARPALAPLSFALPAGTTLTVAGPSGAGKTTLLRAITGLVPATGSVSLNGRTLDALPPQERKAALVPQNDALVETMTLRENLRFICTDAARVEQIAADFGIADVLASRPRSVSGGQRQRAAIARAVLSDPAVLLLDEPFAHLDPPLRADMARYLGRARGALAGPMVYVTHDHAQAVAAGDLLAILINGELRDIGPPMRVYARPAHVEAARFFGERAMNVIDAPDAFFPGDALVGIRAEDIRIAPGTSAQVLSREETGADVFLRVRCAYGEVVVRARREISGEALEIDFPRAALCRFDRRSGERID